MCHASDNTNTQTVASNAQHSYRTKTNGYAHCPIMKDNTGNTGLTALRIYGGHPQFVSGSWCEVGSLAVNGGGSPAYNWGYLPGFNSGSDKIDFGSTLNAGQTDGMFYINCWMVGNGTTGAYVSEVIFTEP
jgi:hypothetical protein